MADGPLDDAFLVQSAHGGRLVELDRPHPTICASDDRHGLIVHLRGSGRDQTPSSAKSIHEPMGTITAGGQKGHGGHHALVMRNNTGGAEMLTPVDEPVRTLTTKQAQSLVIVKDMQAKTLLPPCPDLIVDEFGYRMLTAPEMALGMALPRGYIPTDLYIKDQIKLAGNAVTPPVMRWIISRLVEALGPGMTVTDLFCGAGGNSLGAQAAGMIVTMAANHWPTAIDVHQAHFPDAAHDCADINQVDPRRYPRTNVLIASPECTNHSSARGISRRKQNASLFEDPDPAAERSRATMWDVIRFTEQMRYEAVVVENVWQATDWVLWPAWVKGMEDLGYTMNLLSINSQDHGVPQSRDRIFVVWMRNGLTANFEHERDSWCDHCEKVRPAQQRWKNNRTVGVYRQQWIWACTSCHQPVQPPVRPAADIIDWDLPCPRIGDRPHKKRLVANTRRRIWYGAVRHGWVPFITNGAGNTYETTPGNRARPVHTAPLPTQQTTAQHALAIPPTETP